ncbi:MAG: glycosyltransferase family 4 protein [Candidatus Heimdallarchaeaceae archaeon]
MKIVVAHNTMATAGGAQIVTEVLINHLSKLNHEVHFITNALNKKFKYRYNQKIKLYELSSFSTNNIKFWLYIFIMKLKIHKIIEEIKPELIISTNFPMNYLSLNEKIVNVYYCHEPFPFFYFPRYVKNMSKVKRISIKILTLFFKNKDLVGGKKTDIIIANSKFTKKLVKEIYNRTDAKVLYPPIFIPKAKIGNLKKYLDTLNNYKKLNRILIVSPSSAIKGFDHVQRLFEYINNEFPNKRYLILITGKIDPSFVYCVKRMRELNICEVISVGFVEREELTWLYQNFGYTLYLSEKEPFGLVPVEAFVNKCIPIVIDDESGPSETIINKKNGFKVKRSTLIPEICDILINERTPKITNQSEISLSDFNMNSPVEFAKKLLNCFSHQTKSQ